jgi:hypothetical protein
MKVRVSDRRLAFRYNFNIPIRISFWKSKMPPHQCESENLSEQGIFFATDSLFPIGAVIEVLMKMPEVISGEPTSEWLCSGHVVRVEAIDSPRGKFGVGVQFDCYQVSQPVVT